MPDYQLTGDTRSSEERENQATLAAHNTRFGTAQEALAIGTHIRDVRGSRGFAIHVGATGTATTQPSDAAGNAVPNTAATAVPAGGWVETRWPFYRIVIGTAPAVFARVY